MLFFLDFFNSIKIIIKKYGPVLQNLQQKATEPPRLHFTCCLLYPQLVLKYIRHKIAQRKLVNSAYHRRETVSQKNPLVSEANLKHRADLQQKL